MTIPNTFESLNPSVPEDYGKLPKEIFDKLMTRKQGDRWSLLSKRSKTASIKRSATTKTDLSGSN